MSRRAKQEWIARANLCGIAALGYPVTAYAMQAAAAWLLRTSSVAVPQTVELMLYLLAGGLALLLPSLLGARVACLTATEMYWKPASPRAILQWLPLFLGGAALANWVGGLLAFVMHAPASATRLPPGGWLLALYFAALCVLPAVGEELFFRGVLQGLLRPLGTTAAVGGAALMFGLMHGSLAQCVNAFLCGLLLGLCAEQTGSLVPGICLHFANNVLAFVGAYLSQYGSGRLYQLLLMVLLPVAALLVWRRRPLRCKWVKSRPGVSLRQSYGYWAAVICLGVLCLGRSFELL